MDYRGIRSAQQALLNRLLSRFEKEPLFAGMKLNFSLTDGKQMMTSPLGDGIYLWAYRVQSIPIRVPDRQSGLSRVSSPPIGVEIHALLIPWIQKPDVAMELSGWLFRMLMENAILSAPDLKAGVLGPDETIQVTEEMLPDERLQGLWRAAGVGYRLSIPIVFRPVMLTATT